ncbi:MAG: ABC transporter substrate-binding protein [Limnochordia bacterium]|jgi:multiple sugar transport system substrate-binding protein
MSTIRKIAVCIVGLVLVSTIGAHASATKIAYFGRTRATELAWAEDVAQRFSAVRPDVEVEVWASGTGGGSDYQEKLAVLTAAGTPPDVFLGLADKLGFIVKGFALDITPYVERDRAELQINSFPPGVWESPSFQKRQYGVPLTLTTHLVFYNQSLFLDRGLAFLPTDWDDRSWTWETFLEYCRRLTVIGEQGRYEQLALSQIAEPKLPDICYMFGGDWFEPEAYETGWAERVTMTRPENIKAYEAARDVYARYAAAGPPKGISGATGFMQGRVAMDWAGANRIGASFKEARKKGEISFGLAVGPVPLVQNRMNTRWTNPLFMSTDSKNPDIAWEFVKFATTTQSQELWTQYTGSMPARRTAVRAYIESLTDVFDMSANEILSAMEGSVIHSVRSIEEAVVEAPFEIARRSGEWISPILAGTVPVGNGLATMEQTLNAYIREFNADMRRQ